MRGCQETLDTFEKIGHSWLVYAVTDILRGTKRQ